MAIEEAIIAKLQPLVSLHNCNITSLDAGLLKRPRSGNEVLVHFLAGNPSPPQFLDEAISQNDEIRIEVIASTKNLQTHQVLYPLIEAIRDKLTGFYAVPQASKPLVLLPPWELIVNFTEDGVWAYRQIFTTTVEYTQTENL